MSDGRMSVTNGEGARLPMPIAIAIDDIDASWLTAALASRLSEGVEVRSLSVETIGTGVGLMGLLYRLTVEYDGDGAALAPPTVIVKLPVLIDRGALVRVRRPRACE